MSRPDRADESVGLPAPVCEDLLASSHRYQLLIVLDERGGSGIVTDLAREICARERDTSPDQLGAEEIAAIEREIYDEHLPKLTATGIASYDSRLDKITLDRPSVLDTRTGRRFQNP